MRRFICLILTLGLALSAASCNGGGKESGSQQKDPPKVEEMPENEIVTKFEPRLYEDGIYTVSQSSGDYSASLALPSDNMMVFGNGYDAIAGQIAGWIRDGEYKQIDVFIPLGRDFNSYYVKGSYDGKEHYDIVQTDARGNKLTHPTGDTYYTIPSEGFVDFLIDYASRALQAGAKDVYIEEPDGFTTHLYCDYFKSEWAKVYGEWVDPATDVEARYKADKLLGDILTRAMDKFSRGIKERYPDTKVYICTHSSLSYQLHPISSNNYGIVSAPYMDGLIAQAWTDTSLALTVAGEEGREARPFEVSYSEYSELFSIARETGKKYYSLSDPAADSITSLGFDAARAVYEQNVTAQLLQPEINTFQISIWPDRSFGSANDDYKRVQQEVFACMNEVGKLPATRHSGTVGAAVLMSYNCVSYGNWREVNDYVQSVNVSLLEDGLPVDVLLLEGLSEKTLGKYKTVFLSYDYIKPEDESVNKLLASFVKGGGSLVIFDAGGKNSGYGGFWGDGSAVGALLGEMGLEYAPSYKTGDVALAKASAPSYFGELSLEECRYNIPSLKNGEVYFTADGEAAVVGSACGKGSVIVAGLDASELVKSEEGRDFVRNTAHMAFELAGEKYLATGYIMTERGQYTAIKTYDAEVKLDGVYVNLFDNGMTVVKNPTVGRNSYGLYKKLPADGNARVFLANCANVVSEEVNDVLTFTTATIFGSETAVLVSLPYVNYSDISVTDSVTGAEIECDAAFDEETRMLRLSYRQSVKNPISVSISLNYQ